MFGGSTRLTGQVYHSRYSEDASVATFSPTGVRTAHEFNPYRETKNSVEGGLNHERPLDGWDLALSGLLTRTRYESAISSTHRSGSGSIHSIFTQDIGRDSGETILRATLERDVSASHRIEAGLGRRDQHARPAAAADAGPGRGTGPASDPQFQPRGAGASRRGPSVSPLDIGSPLDPRNAARGRNVAPVLQRRYRQSVSLAYLKPSLQLTRRIGSDDQLRLRVHPASASSTSPISCPRPRSPTTSSRAAIRICGPRPRGGSRRSPT